MTYNLGDRDFIGFSFGEVHFPSEETGPIFRVSDGSRYNNSLTPDFTDQTIEVSGADRTLYFKSNYAQKTINIELAFDGITDEQLRNIKKLLANKATQKLILDEEPYKYYIAKISSPPDFKFLSFTEKEQRIYKGEISISFVCYNPFGYSVYKYLNLYNNNHSYFSKTKDTTRIMTKYYYKNIGTDELPNYQIDIYQSENPTPLSELYEFTAEWRESSHLKETSNEDHNYDPSTGKFIIYNGGDRETHWKLFIPWTFEGDNQYITGSSISYGIATLTEKVTFNTITPKIGDAGREYSGILIDSDLHCVRGATYNPNSITPILTVNSYTYNEYLDKIQFFKLDIDNSVMSIIHRNDTHTKPTAAYLFFEYIYY